MFKVVIRALNEREEVINTSFSGSFAERKEAAAQLDQMVKGRDET